ncbi:TPA: hypothetical protein OMS61_005446 [Enterobacter kobei]|nr:hypothetical protein [Enterobacter kobei]
MFAGKKSAQIREILISESAWEEMTCLFAPSLDEWTLNLVYGFSGDFKNCLVSVDFSVLDYENNDKDATDLRTKFIYKF